MSRYSFLGRAVDIYGNIKPDIGITIYLNGTSTGAIVYTQRTGGAGISTPPQITTDVNGGFKFYVDDNDYPGNQKFDIVSYSITYSDMEIMRGAGTNITFTGLIDTPVGYTGSGKKSLVVNDAEDAIEFEFISGGSSNLDGGNSDTNYGGTSAIDGGDATT